MFRRAMLAPFQPIWYIWHLWARLWYYLQDILRRRSVHGDPRNLRGRSQRQLEPSSASPAPQRPPQRSASVLLDRPPCGDAGAAAATAQAGADGGARLISSTAIKDVMPLAWAAAPSPQSSSTLQGDTPAASPAAVDAAPDLDGDARGAAANPAALDPPQSSAPGQDNNPADACTTPRERHASGLESGTPSTGTLSTCDKQQSGPGAEAAATDDDWSFDTPKQRGRGAPDGWTKQPVALTTVAPSPPGAVAGCPPRAAGLAWGAGSATGPGASQRGAASPATPSSLAVAPHAAAAPGSAASCCSALALSPDFSPHLPLPSVTLLTTHDTSDVSGGGASGAASGAAASSSDGSSGPAPQCTLVAARTEAAAEEGEAPGSSTPSLGAVATGPQHGAPPKKARALHKLLLEPDLRTPPPPPAAALPPPPPRTPLSSSNAANGAPSFRSASPGGLHPATGGGPSIDGGAGGGSVNQKSGSFARRPAGSAMAAAAVVVTPGSATTCGAKPSSASTSRRSSFGASDCVATGSGKKPRYQQSTVSSAMKKQHG